MRSGLIVVKLPGLLLPDEFILKAVETHAQGVGYASVINGKIETTSFDLHGVDKVDPMDAIIETQKKYKDDLVYFRLTHLDEKDKFDSDSLEQPFNVLFDPKNTDEPILSVMLEGEFTEYKGNGECTPEFNFVNDYLYEELEAMFEHCDRDIEKVMEMVGSADYRKELLPMLQPRGELLLIPSKGTPVSLSENKLKRTYEWGYSSNHLGYIDPPKKVVEETTVEPKKNLTFAERQALKKKEKAEEAAPKAPPVEDKPGEAAPEVKEPRENGPITLPNGLEIPAGNPNFYMHDQQIWCKAPAKASWSEIKAFWNRHCTASRPKDDKKCMEGFPAEMLKKDSPLRAFIDKPNTAMREAMSKAQTNPPKTASAEIDKTGPIQVIPVDDRKRALGVFVADSEANKDATIEDITKVQEGFGKFTEQTGISLEMACRASIQSYFKIGQRNLCNLANELRMELLKLKPELGKKKVVAEPAATTTATPEKKLTFAERKAAEKLAKVA